MINVFQPSLGEEELRAVSDVFHSNWIGKGKAVADFEAAFAKEMNAPRERFLSTTSCTEALFVSPKTFDLGVGDEVIAPSISFVAVGSAFLASGVSVKLCDVDPRTLNARLEDIERVVTRRTRAVIVTHYGGFPCEMDPIIKFCSENNILVFEDTACAVRAVYNGKACGTLGDFGSWSFDAMKTICLGDGGMMYIKDPAKLECTSELLYLGLPARQKSGTDSANTSAGRWWEYEVNRFGRRSILNNIAGAIGLVQLSKINVFLARRKQIFERYMAELRGVGDLVLPPQVDESRITPSHYFFWVQTKGRDALARYLYDQGVYSTFRYWPLHRIKGFNFSHQGLSGCDYAADHTLNLPLHHSLTDENVAKVVESVKKFFVQ